MDILIKNGVVVSPDGCAPADVRVKAGLIETVSPVIEPSGEKVVDASGMLVFPGFIDSHTHFDMDAGAFHTADDFESGTAAAVLGGTTTVLDFATQDKGGTLLDALGVWKDKAGGKSACDYGFHMAITDWNAAVAAEIPLMRDLGVTSFKVYMAYDALRLPDAAIYDVLKAVGKIGGIVGVHCENGDLVTVGIAAQKASGGMTAKYHPRSRPNAVEAEAVNRLLTIAELADTPVNIVHISTREALALVRAARAKGREVYAETCPHYLLLDASVYDRPGPEASKYVCSPPIRSPADQSALWAGIMDGQIDTIGTDHCSFRYADQKAPNAGDFAAIPNGLPGVQNRPALMYTYGVLTGKMPPESMAALLSENIARLFGMYPQKGVIRPAATRIS
jgi:dihydropyrimidinase